MKSIINDVYISLCKFVFFMKGLKRDRLCFAILQSIYKKTPNICYVQALDIM